MFSGREYPRGTTNVKMENLFVQIFERKRRIVEQVKQQVDLYDQHLASKCLLAGVSPPTWLWSPSLPSQTSELNKEEIISELLLPRQSRPSIICPSSRHFSYQQPVSFLADNVVRQDLTSVVKNPLEEHLLEEEQQNDLSHNFVRRGSDHPHEQYAIIASPRDVPEKERLSESVSIGCKENQSCPSPEHFQDQRVETYLDATSPGCSQGTKVPKRVSTTGCKRKSSPLGYFQDETDANTCLDPGLSLAKMQRSRSRQKALELRSSAKASKSRSNSRNVLKHSPRGNIGLGIASFRSDSVSEIKLFKHEENDEGYRDEVENSSYQGKGEDQCIKISPTTESFTPHQTADEVSAKVNEEVDDPQSRSCNEKAYLDGGTRSKSSSQNCSNRKHQRSRNSFSDDSPSRNSNPSHWADHEVESSQVKSMANEVFMVTDAETSILQSEVIERSRSNVQGDISKTENSGSVESSSMDVEPRDSISLLLGDHVKESLNPSTVDVEGLVVGNITSNDQSKEKGECDDTNRCSSAKRVSQTGISPDETTFGGAFQGTISKTLLLGCVESSSVELQSRHSVMQSDDESVLSKPDNVPGEALLVEEDYSEESIEVRNILKSSSLSLTDIRVVEPVVVESILQESGTAENLIDHSKRCEVSCVSKEMQPQGSLSKAGSNQCHGRISRPRSSAIGEESANEYKAPSVGSDLKSADKQLKVKVRNSLLESPDLPLFVKPELCHLDDNEKRNINEVPMNSQEKSTIEKATTPASSARVYDVPSLTYSEVNLPADKKLNDIQDHYVLEIEMVPEMESHASHTGLKVGDNQPPETKMDALTKIPEYETSSEKGLSPINMIMAGTETGYHCPESSIQEHFCSSSSMGGSQLQNKRRRTMEKLTTRVPSSSPQGDILNSDYVREVVQHREEAACYNLNNYEVELEKMIGSASSDHYDVELQKMIGSASSAELRFEERYLFEEAGLMSPASLSFKPEQLSLQRSQITPDHGVRSENMNFLPCSGETSHPLASGIVRDSDHPCLPHLGLISSDDGSPPVLEGFIIQTDYEDQSGSKNQINHDNFQLPRTTAESAAMIEQICKSACMTTPSLHLAKTFNLGGKLDLDQSVSAKLLDGVLFNQNLEGSSVFDKLGINHDYTGRSYTDSLPFSGSGSSADDRNPCTSPTEKLWYRSLQKSSSSEKRGSQTPDLPCITEENENVEEEAENLCISTLKSRRSEKQGSSIRDLPCIAEENENIDNISEAVNEVSDTERENVSAKRKSLGDVNEDPTKFLPSISEDKIPVDRQSLDSVNTAFSFSATCNSVKSKVVRQNGGSQRFTRKGKENQGAGRNTKPPSSRFSKAKLSCNSSLTTLGPPLPEKEPRHNNIVSNITSFVPLVLQQKPAPALMTGKRDVKVKALEAAEASKRIAEQKENDRKMKKEAMKLERARLEQENLRKQEMEKKKKEEDRKKKDAEIAWKQEIEKKKKEEERKRKEFEMADRKRQREEEDKKLKEAKRQRIAEIQRQQREADQKLQAEKESKRHAMDARIKAQKETNAEKTQRKANARIPEVRPKSNSSDDANASKSSRDDDFKVITNLVKMSEEANIGIEKMEESYDMSPYKCSDDEDEEEDDISNKKIVPTWASKDNVLLAVISQQNVDPNITIPAISSRDINKVLLPRKFQSR